MMSMEERREAIQAQLRAGKMTLRELATAIGVETGKNQNRSEKNVRTGRSASRV
ncbi:MAG: hypothetical protein ACLR8P_01710 [Clostridium fessum]